jgi:hypothetical protein
MILSAGTASARRGSRRRPGPPERGVHWVLRSQITIRYPRRTPAAAPVSTGATCRTRRHPDRESIPTKRTRRDFNSIIKSVV